MKKLRTILCTVALLALACSEDSYHYPDAITDFVELETGSGKRIIFIRTDEGKIYKPTTSIGLKDATTDSTYRVRCTYAPEENNRAQIFNVNGVVSPHPTTADSFEEGLIADPVKVVSIWKSGEYINFHLGVMSKGGVHTFHFIKDPKLTLSGGVQVLKLNLYHAQGDDPEAYTRDVFLSCPLSKCGLQTGDSILVSVQTYEKKETFRFVK